MTGSRIRAKSKMAAVYESVGSAVHVGFSLSISLARGNPVDFYFRVVRGIVRGVGVSVFSSPE